MSSRIIPREKKIGQLRIPLLAITLFIAGLVLVPVLALVPGVLFKGLAGAVISTSWLSALLLMVAHWVRVRRVRRLLFTRFLPAGNRLEIYAAIDAYEKLDDESCGIGAPDRGKQDHRLAPFYESIIAHLTSSANTLDVPGDRLASLHRVSDLASRWAAAMISYQLECDSLNAEADLLNAFLSGEDIRSESTRTDVHER